MYDFHILHSEIQLSVTLLLNVYTTEHDKMFIKKNTEPWHKNGKWYKH